jgi:hypothetical protein
VSDPVGGEGEDRVIGTRRTPEAAEVVADEGARPAVADLDRVTGDPIADADPDDPDAVEDAAREALRQHAELTVAAEVAREGMARASALGDDVLAELGTSAADRRPPMRRRYPRWGWREAVRFAVQRRMYTPQFLELYRRHAWHVAAPAQPVTTWSSRGWSSPATGSSSGHDTPTVGSCSARGAGSATTTSSVRTRGS